MCFHCRHKNQWINPKINSKCKEEMCLKLVIIFLIKIVLLLLLNSKKL